MDYLEHIQQFQPLRKLAMQRLINGIKQEPRLKIVNTENFGHDSVFEIVVSHRGKLWKIHAAPFSDPRYNEYEYHLQRPGEKLSAWTIHKSLSPNGYELMLEYILEN